MRVRARALERTGACTSTTLTYKNLKCETPVDLKPVD